MKESSRIRLLGAIENWNGHRMSVESHVIIRLLSLFGHNQPPRNKGWPLCHVSGGYTAPDLATLDLHWGVIVDLLISGRRNQLIVTTLQSLLQVTASSQGFTCHWQADSWKRFLEGVRGGAYKEFRRGILRNDFKGVLGRSCEMILAGFILFRGFYKGILGNDF